MALSRNKLKAATEVVDAGLNLQLLQCNMQINATVATLRSSTVVITSTMALSSSQSAEQDYASNSQTHGGNNDDHLSESSTSLVKYQQDTPETSARTSKTVEALLNTDAFMLDGEWFYDAVAVDGEDTFTAMSENTGAGYWGLQLDSETGMVYYFNHSHPEDMQWLPPTNLIHPDTHEVLLWDASVQWFYYYNPQTKESRWLEEKTSGNVPQQQADEFLS